MMESDEYEQRGVEVGFNYEGGGADAELDMGRLEGLVKSVCGRFGVCRGQVSVTFVDEAGIVEVNKRFLGRDSSTDVISFDLSEEEGSERIFEIVVNAHKARAEAEARGHGFEAEAALYIVHGLLHNFGFDDADEQQGRRMHEAEDEILAEHEYGIVYKSD